jgi:hypothetical protein
MAMDLKIQRQGEPERHLKLERLVNTVGFGDGCDVVLATSGRTERLGMFIQQGEGLNFRPLHQPSGVFMNGQEIESMVAIPAGTILRVLDYDLSWTLDGFSQESEPEPKRWAPPVSPSSVRPLAGYRAGAMMAYGKDDSPRPLEEKMEGVELAWSNDVPAKEPTRAEHERHPRNPSNQHPSNQQSSRTAEPQQSRSLGAAEAELARKLEEARQRMEGGMGALSDSLDESMGMPLNQGQNSMASFFHHDDPQESHDHEEEDMVEDLLPMRRVTHPEPPLLPQKLIKVKGQTKDVLKHFFNHLGVEVFHRSSTERRMILAEGLKLSLKDVMGEDEHGRLYARMEKELKGSGPLKELLSDDSVCGLMVRDKGHLYVDRGKGFQQPEMSFFNAVHAYWSLDRLLLSVGIKMDWSDGQKSFRYDPSWGGRVILPGANWQGAYVVMRRRKEQRSSFVMEKASLLNLAERVKRRENLLIVAPDITMAQHLVFWFLKQAESLGPVLVLSKEQSFGGTGDFPKRIGVALGDEDLPEWVKWSEGMDLAGTLHGEPLVKGFDLLRTLAHQQHGWWQLIIANGAESAVEKCELDLSIERPELRPHLIQRLIKGVFSAVVSIDGKSISGRRHIVKVEDVGVDQQGKWMVPPRKTSPAEGDWED